MNDVEVKAVLSAEGKKANTNAAQRLLALGKAPAPAKSSLRRETFSMPDVESKLIDELLSRARRAGRFRHRSEIVRAAVSALASLDDKGMVAILDKVEHLKPGKRKR